MEFTPEQEEFGTYAQRYLWGLGTNLSQFKEITPQEISAADESNILAAEHELYSFFKALFEDMYQYPEKYKIPVDALGDEIKSNEKRLKATRVINGVFLDFIYKLGQIGRLESETLVIGLSSYLDLVAEKQKKLKSDFLIGALEHLGFNFNAAKDVVCTNKKYPKMLIALSYLSKVCMRDRVHGFYHFRRCDFRMLNPEFSLDINDVLRILPGAVGEEVGKTDSFLTQLKYRRKIEPYSDFGYRLSYSNKAGVVCYCHVHSYLTESLYYYIRWVPGTCQSTKVLSVLAKDSTQFADYVFDNISRCSSECIPGFGAVSQDQCIARIKVEWNGRVVYICKDARWNEVNQTSRDFKYVQKVLRAIHEVLYEEQKK